MHYLIIFTGLSLLMLAYLRVASRYNIIDKPNKRSSHTHLTIRGGGIIFVVSVILWWIIQGFQYPLFFAGFLLISIISFIDDLGHLHNRIRLLIQLLAVALLLLEIAPMVGAPHHLSQGLRLTDHLTMVGVSTNHPSLSFTDHIWLILSLPIILGFLNAYNFMDGINGITVLNSLVTVGTLYYLNIDLSFIDQDLMIYSSMGLLVFGFFNFRTKAACFAGDIGAVSMAFLIAFALISLIIATNNFYFVALVFVYGVDTVGTIIERLIKKENIFEAHRAHLYQLMANQSGMPHLVVSTIYGLVQLLINLIIIYMIINGKDPLWMFCSLFLVLVAIFAFAKIRLYRVFD